MRALHRVVCLWLAVAAAGPCAAQARPHMPDAAREPRLQTVGANAIPRSVVASLAQDRAGFLWIATGDGLVRYDGYRFRPQERDSAVAAERNLGWIRAMLPARDGRLWIGTESQGLAVYEPAQDRIVDHGSASGKQAGQPTVTALAEGADGMVWVGSFGGGLERFDPAHPRFSSYRHTAQTGSLPDDRVQALLVDRSGTLWVGTWQGLSRLRPGSDRFEAVGEPAGLRERVVQALFQASDGQLWVGTAQGELAIVDPHTGQWRLLAAPAGAEAGDAGAVTRLAETADGTVWVGRSSGIDLHDRADGRPLRALRHDRRRPNGLAGNEVTALLVDHEGDLWIGGFGIGLQRHRTAGQNIWLRSGDNDPGSPLANPDLRAVLALRDGEVWVATHSGDVAVLGEGLRLQGRLPPPQDGRPWRVTAMVQAADGSVWLGADGWLSQYSAAHRLMRRLPTRGGEPRRLLQGADGALWAAMLDGLYLLRPGAQALTRVSLGDGQALAGEVTALAEDAGGAVWIGTVAGLMRVAAGSASALPVLSAPGQGLGNPSVAGLLFDRAQTLWVDTGVTGLHRLAGWDGRLARFDRVSERHGVVSRPFGANLLQDGRGRIWTHMYVYDPANDKLTELTAADGVDFGTGWFRSYARTSNGRLLFGGSKGLLVVEPDAFDAATDTPQVVATELRINGERLPVAPSPQRVRLLPGQRSLTLEFAALDFSDPQRLRYAYRLEGFDPAWIETDASFRAPSYSNLPPGDYQLRVRATNRSGVWSPHELALVLQVEPAWWQGWGFRGLAALAAAALVALLVQVRTRSLRHRHQALEQLVRQRTVELEEASRTDPLTGLRNRRFLTQHIEAVAARAMRPRDRRGTPDRLAEDDTADLVFFLVDIDHFKQVNDRHGHAAGDAVIMQMRARLQSVFRASDYLVRWGGEEFLVVACDTPRHLAAGLAERVRRAVADQAFTLDDGSLLQRNCSIGFSCFPLSQDLPEAMDWHEGVRLADVALFAAKDRGRNGWVGLVQARADSAQALQVASRQALSDWVASGQVESVSSPLQPLEPDDG